MEAGGGGRNTTRFEISSDEISTIDEVGQSFSHMAPLASITIRKTTTYTSASFLFAIGV